MEGINDFWISTKKIYAEIRKNKILYFFTRRKKYKDKINSLYEITSKRKEQVLNIRCKYKY